MESKSTENVKVLDKALTILDMLKEADRPVGVNEISKHCFVNPTTSFRILKTLKNKGWVYQDENDKYTIGHKISFVTDKNNFYIALKEIAYYTMSRLSSAESEAMNLIVRDNEKCLILQQSRTEKIIDYIPPAGTFLPVYACAGGKILLSELPELILGEILDKTEFKAFTKHTIVRRTAFLEELEKVKHLGYAVDAHETQEEGFCIAVPVRSKENEIIAALSFSGFIGKISEGEINYYYQLLKKASAEITGKLYSD